jgi:dTDP-glucose 4,6-dehydratase
MNILVTGGAGFIGSNFIKYMLATYHSHIQIVNVDKLTYAGNLENLTTVEKDPRYKFIQGDICNLPGLLKDENIDVVVHFAAETHVDRSIGDGQDFIRTNVLGISVLLEAAKTHKLERFIYVSTDEVYGSLSETDARFSEQSPIHPNSPYSASKTGADLLALSHFQTFGTPVIVTRCSNNYGPNQHPEKFIPLAITNALQDKPIPVYGDGKNVRDWIYVLDHCRALIKVLDKGTPGEVYNIGGNSEMTNIEVVNNILMLLNKPYSLITYVTDRLGHDRRYAVNPTKLHLLGWNLTHEFELGLEQTINWYKANTEWWSKLK